MYPPDAWFRGSKRRMNAFISGLLTTLATADSAHIRRLGSSWALERGRFNPCSTSSATRALPVARVLSSASKTSVTGLVSLMAPRRLVHPPQPGSLDALMTASYNGGPFAVDLRRLSEVDRTTVRTVTQQRIGNLYLDLNPLDAFDLVVHLPQVTAAEPDPGALTCSPPRRPESVLTMEARITCARS